MRYVWILLPLFVLAEESFMTDYEYGEMLYNNPRGISCAQCHGVSGEGKMIASYTENKKTQAIVGADIRKKSLDEMTKSIHILHAVMPNYYLTDKEMETMYEYLQEKNKSYLGK